MDPLESSPDSFCRVSPLSLAAGQSILVVLVIQVATLFVTEGYAFELQFLQVGPKPRYEPTSMLTSGDLAFFPPPHINPRSEDLRLHGIGDA